MNIAQTEETCGFCEDEECVCDLPDTPEHVCGICMHSDVPCIDEDF
ncbi:hypothetical protein [Glycomyces paridis]|nr:hypothetical protein [Glycomyces paridis]